MKIAFSFLFLSLTIASPGFSASAYQLTPILKDGIEDPVYIAPVPGEVNTYWILEQAGRIRRFRNGQLEATPVLDIVSRVRSGGEMGLLGLAFHPQFARNRRFFVNYNPAGELSTVIAEFNADTLVETRVMKFAQPFTNHKGGMLEFDHQGHLFITVGDGGSGGDPQGNGQKLDTLLGKMLRIDVNGKAPYSIPNDNPLVGKSGRPEIFAWGLRNVWRFSFDRKTGLLFAADVGQNRFEEINIIEKGKNYGWGVWEANHCYKPDVGCRAEGMTMPIHEYPRAAGISVTGGYVYRGTKLPVLSGKYIFGDFGSGKVWGLTWDEVTKTGVKNELLLNSQQPISSFGEDNDGELLVVSYAGIIYRLEAKEKKRK